MKTPATLLGLAGALALGVTASVSFLRAQTGPTPASPAPASDTVQVERGRYLVMSAGLCIDCHSPRNEKGEFIESQHLTGAPIMFLPTVPMPWVPAAPRLAGLPAGFTESEVAQFLVTGERPHGRPPALPPMPPYRFNHEDAAAIAAYLHSLPANPTP